MSKTLEIKKNKQTNTGRTHFKKGVKPWNAGTIKMFTGNCYTCEKEFTVIANRGRVPKFCSIHCSVKNLQKPEIIKKRVLATIGYKRTAEQRAKVSGDKCYLWKGGITPINFAIRNSYEYKLWRTSVFQRDNYTCIWCGATSGNGKTVILNADHIKPFAFFLEFRFDINNGRTLCKKCHLTTETHGRPKKKTL